MTDRLTVVRHHAEGSGTPALLVHGVTANAHAWDAVAAATDRPLIAPDLRGRGRSADLVGPAGMDNHAADLLAVLDDAGIERAVLVGHSMGGFVVSTFANAHPDRVAGVLLVDGGLPLAPPPPSMTPDEVIAAVIGPAAARLGMTFADSEAYLDYWRPHPALQADWSPLVEDYLRYDLVGEPPACRSSVRLQAVREDSIDLLDAPTVAGHAAALPPGTTFLRAPAGLMAEPGGLYPPELVELHRAAFPHLAFVEAPDANHYTLVMAPHGASRVVAEMDRLSPR